MNSPNPKYIGSMFIESNDNHSHNTERKFIISITDRDEHWAVMYKTLHTYQKHLPKRLNV